jgi:peptide/nickel transport system substrate-binding protein
MKRIHRIAAAVGLIVIGTGALGLGWIVAGAHPARAGAMAPDSALAPRSQRAASAANPIDEFHPDRAERADGTRAPMPAPAYGGRAIVGIESMPTGLNCALDNIAVARRIAYETHETLLLRDWNTGVLEPDLCKDWIVEDQVFLADADGKSAAPFGRVTEEGDAWVITPASPENPLRAPSRVEKSKVARVERGTVFTFHLRDDVVWHDGHPFDAPDVDFSLSTFDLPGVRNEKKRFQFEKVLRSEVLAPHTVRVTWAEQYFMAEASIGDLFLLPSHLYDLSDPDNAKADPEWRARKLAADPGWKPTPADQAEYVNANPHNQRFVGLGPYKVTTFGTDFVEATRFDEYFDPARAGWLDTLRWRAIPDTGASFRAFLNGDVDFTNHFGGDDFYSDAASSKEFEARAYRGWHDTSSYWYVGWNCARPPLADARVRRALAHLFDFDEFKNTYYRGHATQVTGPFPIGAPSYAHDVKPLPFSPDAAKRLLAEAGFYDRDGDGLVDHDGKPLSIELAMQAGHAGNQAFGAKLQENMARVGVQLRLAPMDLKAVGAKRDSGDFDAVALGWAPPYESDPGQIWHSTPEGAEKGSNYVGFADAEVDRLIEAGRKELDTAARAEIWRRIHRRLYELQPYLFCYNVPRKFLMNRALRGFESVPLEPNYVVRRWYYAAGTPGTRATAAKK